VNVENDDQGTAHAGILLIKNGPRVYGCPLVSTIYG